MDAQMFFGSWKVALYTLRYTFFNPMYTVYIGLSCPTVYSKYIYMYTEYTMPGGIVCMPACLYVCGLSVCLHVYCSIPYYCVLLGSYVTLIIGSSRSRFLLLLIPPPPVRWNLAVRPYQLRPPRSESGVHTFNDALAVACGIHISFNDAN